MNKNAQARVTDLLQESVHALEQAAQACQHEGAYDSQTMIENQRRAVAVMRSKFFIRTYEPPPCPCPDCQPEATDADGVQTMLWKESLDSRFPSKLEKLRDRLIEQRKGLKSTNQRDFILRKIAILNEVLDGPMPAEERVATTATSGEPQQRPPTLSELVEGGRQ